jgi:hypothetical protein
MNKIVLTVSWIMIFAGALLALSSCSVGNAGFSPSKKYSHQQLEKDYDLYQHILEAHHPGLYWYTSKDSMDRYFNWGRQHLADSMTEPEFRKLLSYVTAKIDCGHTTVRSSKAWSKYSDTVRIGKMFPLSMKVWDKAMVVTASLLRRDSVFRRGTVINAINGRPWQKIVDTLFEFISTDGYNTTHKYQTLSNRGFFGSLYTNLFGLSERYTIQYTDSTGQTKTAVIPVFNPGADTTGRAFRRPGATTRVQPPPQPSKKERKDQQKNSVRLLRIDTLSQTAMMDLSSFGRGYGLKKFFRNSFHTMNRLGIKYLIIDVRGNGGGSVSNSTQLSRYMADHKFKFSDSLYAIRKHSPYQRYIEDHFWNRLFISLFTRKKKDGNYHFGYFERHYFKPKQHDHFYGKVYIITGGNSFSATTLFASSLIKQENVLVVGEETGGGAYGNSAWLIPDVTLPETGVRFRLPLFRLVIDKNVPKTGKGVQPEIYSGPTIENVRSGADYKLDKVTELINEDKRRSMNQ